MADAATLDTRTLVRRSALTFVGLAGASGSLTILFLCMRSVMDVGGVCVSGNSATTIRVQCPVGVPGLMIGSIFGGLIFLGIYAISVVGPNLTLFAWPALFLSLGWNFLEYGISPPGGGGPSFGWLFCAAIFGLMGGIPLVLGVAALVMKRASRMTPDIDALSARLSSRTWRTSGAGNANDSSAAMARLDALHKDGTLTDDEYEAAKMAAKRKEQLK